MGMLVSVRFQLVKEYSESLCLVYRLKLNARTVIRISAIDVGNTGMEKVEGNALTARL